MLLPTRVEIDFGRDLLIYNKPGLNCAKLRLKASRLRLYHYAKMLFENNGFELYGTVTMQVYRISSYSKLFCIEVTLSFTIKYS